MRRAHYNGQTSQLAILTSSGQLEVYDTASWQRLHRVPLNHAGAVTLTADHTVVAGVNPDQLSRVSLTAPQSPVSTLPLRTGGIRCILPLTSQQWAVSTGANWLHLVAPDLGESIDAIQLPQRIQEIREIDGHVWVAALDGTVHRVAIAQDAWDQARMQTWSPRSGQLLALQAVNQQIVAVTSSGTILTIPRSAESNERFSVVAHLPESVRSARFSGEDRVVVGLTDGTVGEFYLKHSAFLP